MDMGMGPCVLGEAAWVHNLGQWLSGQVSWWKLVGYVGQSLFFMRFMVQWIASERAGRSIIPMHFWVLSIGGSLILAVYAFYTKDLVFILGYSINSVVYIRNIMLIQKEKRAGHAGHG